MNTDELEFAISQYIDGTLPPLETARVEEILASNADARAVFAEYQKLNSALRAQPLPAVDWQSLGDSISREVAREDAPAIRFRIGLSRVTQFVATAAAVMVIVGTAALLLRKDASAPGPEISIAHMSAKLAPGSIQITGPSIQVASAPAVTQISIGPASGYDEPAIFLAEAIVSRPARVVIASAARSAQDSGESPY